VCDDSHAVKTKAETTERKMALQRFIECPLVEQRGPKRKKELAGESAMEMQRMVSRVIF
jgi:hypothetical protein